MTDYEILQTILMSAMWVSPTVVEQQAFTKIHNDMLLAGESVNNIRIALLRSMLDGLEHDNWPKSE